MLCDTIGHAIAAAVNEMVIMGLAIMMLFSMPPYRMVMATGALGRSSFEASVLIDAPTI
jgi:hypothetical protein